MFKSNHFSHAGKDHGHRHSPHEHKSHGPHGHNLAAQEQAFLSALDGPLTDDTVLCRCHQVTVKQVKEAIASGAATVEQVMTLTDLGGACGHCVGKAWPVVQDLLGTQ